jgi:phage terminase small subunit
MNARQTRFAHEYATLGNATQAATNAGYSPKTAHVTGSRLLRNAEVQREIRAIQDGIMGELGMDQKHLVAQLYSNHAVTKPRMETVIVTDENGAVIEYEQLVGNPAASNKALELLGKHVGLFVERQEITYSGGLEITINGVDISELS